MKVTEKALLYAEAFKQKYGDKEVRIEKRIVTIYDNFPGPHSSGSNGYITKARVRDSVLEFYHDWWNYGWFSYKEMHKEYARAINKAIRELGLNISINTTK